MKNKFLLSGAIISLVGVAFLLLERVFYQYVDEEGFLQESLFLPLGLFFLIIGLLLLFISLAKKLGLFSKKHMRK